MVKHPARYVRSIRMATAFAGTAAALLVAGVVVVGLARATLTSPAPTAWIRTTDGRFLTASTSGPQGYWPLEEVPSRVAAATIALEDRRFLQHPGVDPVGVVRALWQNLRAGHRVSGASTLAMQVARLQHPGPRTYIRKATEAVSALALTARYGREAILEHYLRIVPYGNQFHGIGLAARAYFDKPVDDLSWAEIAFLAAIPQSPSRMNPYTPQGRSRAVARGRRILDALKGRGVLGAHEFELAIHELSRIRVKPRGRRPSAAMHAVLRLERMLEDVRKGEEPLVTATLDQDLQERVADLALRALRSWRSAGAGNVAVLVVDLEGFKVRAAVGSADYFDGDSCGAIDYTRVQRFVGSTLKPFIYALALDTRTITPTSILDDILPGPGGVQNADHRFLGPLLPRFALANSRNVPAVNLVDRLGQETVYAFYETLGLHHRERPPAFYGLGLALGAMPISLEQLVRAYTALAGGGVLHDLTWYEGQAVSEPRRILSEEAARLVTLYLSDPSARLPSFPRMGAVEYPYPVALKTGTSAGYRDAWTVAWSRRYLVGVWVGRPDYGPMKRLSGFHSAAVLVHQVMDLLHPDWRDGQADRSFPPPRGFVPRRICPLSGTRASDACAPVVSEWMAPEDVPTATCRMHLRRAVDRRTGRPATSRTPLAYVELRTFLDLPPRYVTWAASSGLPVLGGERAHLANPRKPLEQRAGQLLESLASSPGMGPVPGWTKPLHVEIVFPKSGTRFLMDPELPPDLDVLTLKAGVSEPVPELLWYVDGVPFHLVPYPYTVQWQAVRGEHVFVAEVPMTHARSRPVHVILEGGDDGGVDRH